MKIELIYTLSSDLCPFILLPFSFFSFGLLVKGFDLPICLSPRLTGFSIEK